MKTKTLLIAAAALTAGVISSEAQVYSQNIVGYANVVLVGGYNLVCNPFDDGNGNHLTNVINPSILPAKSSVTTWNTSLQGYNGAISGGAGSWNADTTLPPGSGFFIKNGTIASPTVTNTFVGTIVLPVGASGTNALVNNFTLAGSQVPYAGDLMSDTNLNLVNSGLAGKSSVTTWNPALQGYNGAVGFGSPSPIPVTVGQGYFIKSVQGPINWVQTLNP
ncbi:MAG TPA: hypothetical protein VNN22_19755 [Verrucomicrobiae bacterium]|nr:hypothetical protein [Verrucomicrobiae bacterium]